MTLPFNEANVVLKNTPKTEEAAEKYTKQIAEHIASVFHKYIIKQRKIHGDYVFPATLNVCARIVVSVVKMMPANEQIATLNEFAALLAHIYRGGGPPPEEKRIITLDQLH
jgi:hypothetical protein